MQQEIRFATFNVCNLGPAGAKLYDNLEPLTAAQYDAKVEWIARQIDLLGADVIGFQEIFSQAALRDALSRTRHYRDAFHAGFDADLNAPGARLTPNVALVSRLPLLNAQSHANFPDGVHLETGMPDANADRYARAPLHAEILLPNGASVDVLVIHLKSRRPDYRNGDNGSDPLLYAMANLRSLVRRGTEAVALRVLLSQLGRAGRARIVLGDFNDVADAVTTGIVLGAGASLEAGQQLDDRMFDCNQIQLRQDYLRHVGYTNVHDGHYMTIDHILVSEQFHPQARQALGAVLDVTYLNDHLMQGLPQASDHGQVLARIQLYDRQGA